MKSLKTYQKIGLKSRVFIKSFGFILNTSLKVDYIKVVFEIPRKN